MTPLDPDRNPQRYFGTGVLLLVVGLAFAGWPTLILVPLGLAFCAIASYSRRHGWLLLGPLAGWELTRAARRGRMHIYRVVLVLAALLYLSTVYAQFVSGPWHRVFTAPGVTLTPSKASHASSEAFAAFGIATAVFVALSAVVGLSPVIAEERERKRLDHLLVTDLRSREIVLGKMIGRLAITAGYVVMIVPVLALLTVIGGVAAEDALIFGAMAILALVGLTGCALIATGEQVANPGLAIFSCVGSVWIFIILTALCLGVAHLFSTNWSYPPATDWIVVVFRFLAAGNPGVALADLIESRPTRDPVTVLCHFAAGQVMLFTVGLSAAVEGLRAEPKKTTEAKANQPVRVWPMKPRPEMTDEPVRWMEVEYNTGRIVIFSGWRRVVGRAIELLLVTGFGFACVAALVVGWLLPHLDSDLPPVFATVGGIAIVAVTLPTAWIAARGIARERETDTLEALRLTGLTPTEILTQKWHAARDLTRPLLKLGLFCVGIGVASTALPLWVAIVMAGLMYANWCIAASIGVAISVVSRKASHAVLRLAGVGLLCYLLCGLPSVIRGLPSVAFGQRSAVWVGFAVNPPVAGLVSGALAAPELRRGQYALDTGWLAVAAVVAAASSYLWSTLPWRFAIRRFTRDLTPATDGTEVTT